MVAVVFVLIILICIFIFSKTDTKRAVLGSVGLDLNQNVYESCKEKEFEKYCKKGLMLTIEKCGVRGKDEKEFLQSLNKALKNVIKGSYFLQTGTDIEGQPVFERKQAPFIDVKRHYIQFAAAVVKRRLESMDEPGQPVLVNNCNYSQNNDVKFYINRLWSEYQYPWPDNWMINDGI